ncbi:hypothetical protein PFLUV_G00185660 [Perca fluviatilis]|uniref:C1q domain-containing protein n=1 Tax=Perca fluviatilis TaxID=8168 RepID=A0A6A5EB55_PERFL|nr:hypothetical protein PFLUV_G00185660 [Perca fluviatilis]
MSYRGRTLVINNLLASSLWHKLSCVDPPSNLLAKIQAVLVNFFWDKLHWIPQSVLFLPLEKGGQGLNHLASRGAAFRLQFLQRLLYGPKDLVWRPLAHWVLNSFKGFGLTDSLFPMDARKLSVQFLPPFYRGVFTVWKLVVKERRLQGDSLHWLLQEPVVYGDQLDYPCWAGSAITDTFCRARVLTLGTVVDITGHKLDNAAALAAVLGVRSVRIITKLLDYWKHKLTGHESILLEQYTGGLTTPQTDDSFPDLFVRPCLDHYEPLVNGSRLDICSGMPGLLAALNRSRTLSLQQLVEAAGPQLSGAGALGSLLGMTSIRVTQRILNLWTQKLSGRERMLLMEYRRVEATPDSTDPFPEVYMSPEFGEETGPLLAVSSPGKLTLHGADKVTLYQNCVKAINKKGLSGRPPLSGMTVQQVAFSAALLSGGQLATIGPFPMDTLLIFKHVITNIGNAYNSNTGLFTAPVRGAYNFEWWLAVNVNIGRAAGAVLFKNSEKIFMSWGQHGVSNGATLLLEVGDIVFMRFCCLKQVFIALHRFNLISSAYK